jgi:hypothetical protein
VGGREGVCTSYSTSDLSLLNIYIQYIGADFKNEKSPDIFIYIYIYMRMRWMRPSLVVDEI